MEGMGDLLRRMPGSRENVPLSGYTSFGTGGPARYMAAPGSLQEVKEVFLACRQYGQPYLILGRGTNLLVSDRGFQGVVILTCRLNSVFVRENRILCECGSPITSLMKTAVSHCLGGIEFLAGIPGSAGGALVSNAGLKDHWISRAVREIYVLYPESLEVKNIKGDEAAFGYRKSGLADYFVYRAVLNLSPADPGEMRRKMRDNMRRRISSQPVGSMSAGSVFKNPPGAFAGQLIEKAGLKGYSLGGARVSPKHANFIVNTGGATSRDIYLLMSEIREKIRKDYNITLEPEIKLAGDFGE